jgi:hypothetical protein
VSERQQDVLQLQPHMIPALRHAFGTALDQLDSAIGQLRRSGNLSEPWLGDEASSETAAHYARRAMGATDSSFASLQLYRSELNRVHDTLQQMEDHYRRTEGDNVERWGRGA